MKKPLSVLLALLLCLTGCGSLGQKRFRAQFLTLFDTVTEIVGYSQSKALFTEQVKQIHAELEQYHVLYDIYQAYDGIANLKTLNDHAAEAPVVVDRKIIDLLVFSKQMYEKTDGRVNIAFGSVLRLWKQYREAGIDDPENAQLPPAQALAQAALHTNIADLVIDEKNSTVFFKDPALKLDVGAIAKGFAVEAVCKNAQARGVNHMLVSVGGNVRAIGKKGLWQPFVVSVKNPDTEAQIVELVSVKVDNESLVSSGDYLRYYTVDGKQYHHIIDPDTLMPAGHFHSVSILSPDSGIADALSTAAYLLDYEASRALIAQFADTEALWVFPDGTLRMTPGFKTK